MKNNSKFLLVCLEERNGEYEYLHRSVHELPNSLSATATRFAKKYAKTFYGSKHEAYDGGYLFNDGEVLVNVESWRFVSKRDFDTLSKYL